jgi:hypothetical protein
VAADGEGVVVEELWTEGKLEGSVVWPEEDKQSGSSASP